jgi:hypothetical protein
MKNKGKNHHSSHKRSKSISDSPPSCMSNDKQAPQAPKPGTSASNRFLR